MSRIRTANLAGALYANTLDVNYNIEANTLTTTNSVNAAFITVDKIKVDNDTISISEANANLVITANGTGVIKSVSSIYVGDNVAAHLEDKGYAKDSISIAALKDSNGAAEIIVINKSNGSLAYSEFLALNDTANQEQGWISIGVNSSEYNDPDFTLTGPDDGYLLYEAPQGTIANGDLIIGTGSYGQNNRIVMAAGGFEPADAQLIIAPPDLKTAEIVKSSLTSNIATLTTANTHNFLANDVVSITGVGAPYDVDRTILTVTSNTFTISIVTGNLAEANVNPAGTATQVLPFNRGSVELTAQLFVGENARQEFNNLNINLDNGVAVPLGTLVNNDGPGQSVMINKSNGTLAYSEFIAHNDVGDVDTGWISIGINSSNYDDPEFPITKADDGYILFEPVANTTGDGDLIIGTGTNGTKNRLIFAAEGFDEANAQMVITPDESVRISINTDSSSANTGALQVAGGVGVSGSLFVQGNQTIQGDLIVNGSQVIQSIASVAAAGPISIVGDGNIANTWDFGIVGTYAKSKLTVTESITNKSLANNTATLTTANNHGFIAEDYAVITDVDSTFNGTHRITAVTANTFSYYKLANNISSTAATGNVTVSSTAAYTGVVKDRANAAWKLVSNIGARPDFNVNFANSVYDNLYAASAVFEGTVNATSFFTSAGLNVTDQANNAFAAANNRVLKAGDTMTGELKLQGSGISLNVANTSYLAGSVGIGTSNPGRKLHVSSTNVDIATFNGANTGLAIQDNGSGLNQVELVGYRDDDSSYNDILLRGVVAGLFINGTTGNVGIGTTSAGTRLVVNGDITANAILGASYSQTSYSSGTAIFDTITTSGPGLYNVIVKSNPNSSGSGSYTDWIYGKIIIGTGFNYGTSVVTDYIYFIQENPDPRSLYDSGGGNLTGDAVFNVAGSEFSSLALGTSYTIRIKVSGHVVNPNATLRLTKIG